MDSTFRVGSSSENAHKMIYVADLPKTTGYLDLSDFFEKNVGPCQICIKRPLFKHCYYAFVMFDSIENAKKAVLDHRNPRIKNGLMSRVLPYNMHAVRGEPGGRDIQSTSIFVKGFEQSGWNHEDLYAKFCTYGKILSCKVSISPDHKFLGFGYIQFSKMEEAQKAIKEMDKYDLSTDGNGITGLLSVLEYQGKKSQAARRSFNNVYVKGFPKDASFTDDHLGELFKEFGEIQSAAIMRDGHGISKGFGFVCFVDGSAAEKATQAVQRREQLGDLADDGDTNLNNNDSKSKSVNGVRLADLYVREAKKKSQRQAELQLNNFKYKKSIMFFSLFVKNFPPGTTQEELKIYFSTACQGEVSRVNMIPGTQQAFVNFEKQDQCRMAKDFARNVLFKSQYALYVEYCYPKEMRAIRNEEFFDRRAQERKKNQQNQQQIQSLNGSQNLVDLLTLLLKSSFQINQGGMANQQRRSHSLNSTHHQAQGNRQMMHQNHVPGGGGNFPMQHQRYQNHRSNFQGPNGHHNNQRYGGNHHQQHQMGGGHHGHVMPRNHSMNPQQHQQQQQQNQQLGGAPPHPSSYMAQQMPMHHQQMHGGQSQQPPQPMSQLSSIAGSQQNGQNQMFFDGEYARSYQIEIRDMFASAEYKQAPDRKTKKDIVGNAIYKHVEKLVGDMKAPKITGMLIDLPEVELNYSIVKWAEFEQKVLSALQMITMNEQQQRQHAAQQPNMVVPGQAPDGAATNMPQQQPTQQQQQAKPQI